MTPPFTYLGIEDRAVVEPIAAATALTAGVARIVAVNGHRPSITIEVELRVDVHQDMRPRVLREAARAARDAAPEGCGVWVVDQHVNRAHEEPRRVSNG